MASPADAETSGDLVRPTPGELFRGFLLLGLTAFGGAMPWARRAFVERRRWLSGDEFTSLLSLTYIVPGPNVFNLAVVIGDRARGVRGIVAATAGFTLVPLVLFLGFAEMLPRVGDVALLRGALNGLGPAAAGLLLATALKIAIPLLRRRPLESAPFIAVAFLAVGVARVPILLALVVLVPVSFAVGWLRRP